MGNTVKGVADPSIHFPMHDGKYNPAKITDWEWGFAFFGYVGLMVCLVLGGFYYGNPGRLSHGINYAGDICGIDEAVAEQPFAYWCGIQEGFSGEFPVALNDKSVVCLASCPTADNVEMIDCLSPAIKVFEGLPTSKLEFVDTNIPNVETLTMKVSQSIVKQKTYPTEEFAGKFCLPDKKNWQLRDSLIRGPWQAKFRFYSWVSSVQSTGLIVGISCVLALIFGFLYLKGLAKYAGPIMFGTMVISSVICLALGGMFVWAMFIGDSSGGSFYCRQNPFYQAYDIAEARMYSIWFGVMFLLFGSCLTCMSFRSMTHIDEMVGIVAATCECLDDTQYFYYFPLWQTILYFCYWFAFLFFGLQYVASYGVKEPEQIIINGEAYQGMWANFTRQDWQWWCIIAYAIGCIWCMEVYIQFGHYVVSYAVACWYFCPTWTDTSKNPYDKMKKLQAGGLIKGVNKMDNIRVAGVDANYGARPAQKLSTDAGDFIMVSVQKKGPGVGRNDIETNEKKKVKSQVQSSSAILKGAWQCFSKRMGSLALGAFPIFFFRPLRIFADCVSAQLSRQGENPLSSAGVSEARSLEVAGCCKIFTQFLDQAVGKYNKMAFMQQVLEGGHSEVHAHGHGAADPDCCCCPKFCFNKLHENVTGCCSGGHGHGGHGGHGHGGHEGGHAHHGTEGFIAAADMAFQQIVSAGGALSYLHGALFIYEAFGTLFVTMLCGAISILLLNVIPVFNDQGGKYYVEDKIMATAVAMISAGCVGFSCMSTFNHTADCLLFCIGWNRKQLHIMQTGVGNKKTMEEFALTKFVTTKLGYLLPPHELQAAYENDMPTTGEATRQIDALFAAMQSGVNSMRTGTPMSYGAGATYSHVSPEAGIAGHAGDHFGDWAAGLASGRY